MQTDGLVYGAASLKPAVNKRAVNLAHRLVQLKNRIFILGYQHKSRGVTVKAVMRAENEFRAVFLRICGYKIRECVCLMLLNRVYRHERRLVYN